MHSVKLTKLSKCMYKYMETALLSPLCHALQTKCWQKECIWIRWRLGISIAILRPYNNTFFRT